MPNRTNLGRKPTGLGRALAKSKSKSRREKRSHVEDEHKHTTEDDEDEARQKKMQSVIDRNALDEFLNEATMAEQEFAAVKEHVVVLETTAVSGGKAPVDDKLPQDYETLQIPRRPKWSKDMSADELDRQEREAFLTWRKQLAQHEESSGMGTGREITPFEKNLEVWRQLWRVVDRSDLLCQIVDARNPLLFRSLDLEAYTREVDPRKRTMLLVNKADFLSHQARVCWAEYFKANNIDFVFFSAAAAQAKLDADEKTRHVQADQEAKEAAKRAKEAELEAKARKQMKDKDKDDDKDTSKDAVAVALADKTAEAAGDGDADDDRPAGSGKHARFDVLGEEDEEAGDGQRPAGPRTDAATEATTQSTTAVAATAGPSEEKLPAPKTEAAREEKDKDSAAAAQPQTNAREKERLGSVSIPSDPAAVLTREQLLMVLFQNSPEHARARTTATTVAHSDSDDRASTHDDSERRVRVGMVGYPNVGKSSTINALFGSKKVIVSATPGKTKHFQTLNIGERVTLCDCPGLVFPTFLNSRSALVVNGILPIDQMRDYISPVHLMCQLVSRQQLWNAYALSFPPDQPLNGEDVLRAHARMRGWVADHGRPDLSRSSRVMLKDFVNGKLLFCYPPPKLSAAQMDAFQQSFPFNFATTAQLSQRSTTGTAAADGKESKLSPKLTASVVVPATAPVSASAALTAASAAVVSSSASSSATAMPRPVDQLNPNRRGLKALPDNPDRDSGPLLPGEEPREKMTQKELARFKARLRAQRKEERKGPRGAKKVMGDAGSAVAPDAAYAARMGGKAAHGTPVFRAPARYQPAVPVSDRPE